MSPQVSLEFQQGIWNRIPITYRKDYIIIKLNVPDQTLDADIENEFELILKRYFESHKKSARIGKWGYFQVFASSGDPQVPLQAEQIMLHERAKVEYAEPDLAMESAGMMPNDPLIEGKDLNTSWELHQWPITELEMDVAWEAETGKDHVLIGVLDSGVPLNTEDEIPPGTIMDGLINHEDLEGKRFIAGKSYLEESGPTSLNDETGHGTKMVGTIAAKVNNRDPSTTEVKYLGIAGMNWESFLYICRILDMNNETTTALFYQAVNEVVDYAAGHDKKLIIHSTVLFKDPEITDMEVGTFSEQCDLLAEKGAIMVFATGNESTETVKKIVRFPAAAATYKPHILVAVGATEKGGDIWEKSNVGGQFVFHNGDTCNVEVTVVAPGNDVATTDKGGSYYSESGTCTAGAHVVGLLSLMWSLNDKMTGEQLIQCLKRTSKIPPSPEEIECPQQYPTNDVSYGHGLIQPKIALECVQWEVDWEDPSLDTQNISFMDVPAGEEPSQTIKLAVKCCADLNFTVRVSGDDFGIVSDTYTHKPEDGPVFQKLTATYTEDMLDSASGTVTIQLEQDPAFTFEVQITANRVGAKNSVIFLAADKSGSMKSASGILSYTRMDVLKYSSKILIDLIEEGSGMGIISFDETAHQVEGLRVIEPGDPGPARTALKNGIDELTAQGWTSIGAGIQRANEDIDSIAPEMVAGDETKAIIVLTDGKENRAPFIADILAEDCPYPVYAIGMGTPDSLEPDALMALSNLTGGYTVITGELNNASEFAIAGFFNKILTEINGEGVALDPSCLLKPGYSQEFQIKVTKADKRLDIILMKPAGAEFDVDIIPPGKKETTPLKDKKIKPMLLKDKKMTTLPDGISVLNGMRVDRYRIFLPLNTNGDAAAHAGIWRVGVKVEEEPFKKLVNKLGKKGLKTELLNLHGVRYALQANVKSNLRFRARLAQDGMEPGSNVLLRTTVTENNLPLSDPTAKIIAYVRHPDGIEDSHKIPLKLPGLYETNFQATIPGVYNVRIVAKGKSTNGDKYQREQILTGIVRSL